jgi:hypothetical protein
LSNNLRSDLVVPVALEREGMYSVSWHKKLLGSGDLLAKS